MQEEIWKNIAGFNGLYQVSNTSRVKKVSKCGTYEMLLKATLNTRYFVVGLNGKNHLLHRLVAYAFVPNPDNKPCVNHIDGVKTNNLPSNLEWCTPLENSRHAIDSGLFTPSGEKSATAKVTEEDVKYIKLHYKKGNARELGAKFGISFGYVVKIAHGIHR